MRRVMIKTVALVSLSAGTIGEDFVKHEVNIGLKRLEQFGLHVKIMPHAMKGIESALPEKLTLWSEDGTSSETPVTYSLKTANKDITLNGNSIIIGKSYTGQIVELTAEAENGQTSDFVVNVTEKLYTYTIYYYDFD